MFLTIKSINTAGQSPAPAACGGFPQQSCGVLNPSFPHSLDHARASTVAISLRSSITSHGSNLLLNKGETITESVGYFSERTGPWVGFAGENTVQVRAVNLSFLSGCKHTSGAGGSFKRVNKILGVSIVFRFFNGRLNKTFDGDPI